MMKIFNRKSVSNQKYAIVRKVEKHQDLNGCNKKDISFLMDQLGAITKDLAEFTKKYDSLTKEEICVICCGDMSINLEDKTVKVGNINRDKALLELANLG